MEIIIIQLTNKLWIKITINLWKSQRKWRSLHLGDSPLMSTKVANASSIIYVYISNSHAIKLQVNFLPLPLRYFLHGFQNQAGASTDVYIILFAKTYPVSLIYRWDITKNQLYLGRYLKVVYKIPWTQASTPFPISGITKTLKNYTYNPQSVLTAWHIRVLYPTNSG